MGRYPMGQFQKRPKERLMPFRPLGDLDKILTAPQHPTKAHDDNVDQRVFEIRTLAAGVGNRLQLLHQGTRQCGHTHSSFSRDPHAARSILTPSFYKGPSASTVHVAPTEGGFIGYK